MAGKGDSNLIGRTIIAAGVEPALVGRRNASTIRESRESLRSGGATREYLIGLLIGVSFSGAFVLSRHRQCRGEVGERRGFFSI